MTDLSIIIPAYNAEDYLEALIDSIVSQDVGEYSYEILIVDDGSNDGTGALCDRLAEQHPVIKVFHQENSGSPSGPRNFAARKAAGHFLFFADADDLFFPDTLGDMIRIGYEKDLSVGLFAVDGSDHKLVYGGLFNESQDHCTVENSKIMNSLGPYKLFSRSLVIDNDIRFPEGHAYEDLPFAVECYLNAKNISVIADKYYYKYVDRETGTSLSQLKEGQGAVFGRLTSRINGLVNYVNVCAKYRTTEECPIIYRRGFRYLDRILKGTSEQRLSEVYDGLLEPMSVYYTDATRAQLAFSSLVRLDAFFYGDRETLRRAKRVWPDGPVLDFEERDGELWYSASGCWGEQPFVTARFPVKEISQGSGLLDPHVRRNRVLEASLTAEGLHVEGHYETLLKLGEDLSGAELLVVVAGQTVAAEASVEDVLCENPYGEIRHCRFLWSATIPLEALEKIEITKTCRASIRLLVHFGSDQVERPFGHERVEDLLDRFMSTKVLAGDMLLVPAVSGYNNLQLSCVNKNRLVKNVKIGCAKKYGDLRLTGKYGADYDLDVKVVVRAGGRDVLVVDGPKDGNAKFSCPIPWRLFKEAPRPVTFEVVLKAGDTTASLGEPVMTDDARRLVGRSALAVTLTRLKKKYLH